MDKIEEYHLKRKNAITQVVLDGDFDKLKEYYEYHGGFDSDTIPIMRIFENKERIMSAINVMIELHELQIRMSKTVHGSIDLDLELRDIVTRGLSLFLKSQFHEEEP